MAQAINNYSWGKIGVFRQRFLHLVDYRVSCIDDAICIAGESLGWDNLKDKTIISTMPIKHISTDKVTTFDNKSYELKQMHPEYINYLKAIDNQIPILTNIIIYGNRNSWYTVFGEIDGRHIAGRIKSQNVERNILTLKMFYGGVIDVFPDWESNQFNKTLFGRLSCTDLKMKDLVRFCGADKVKIIFPLE